MKPDKAFNALQKQELVHKFVEIGKVLLTWAILKNVDMVINFNFNLNLYSTYTFLEGGAKSCISS